MLSSFAVVDFDVEPGTISAGAIAGIVVGSFVFVVLVLAVLRWKGYLGGKETEDSGKIFKVICLLSITKCSSTCFAIVKHFSMMRMIALVLLKLIAFRRNTFFR